MGLFHWSNRDTMVNGDMKTIGKTNDSPKEALLQGLIFEADRIVEESVTQKTKHAGYSGKTCNNRNSIGYPLVN